MSLSSAAEALMRRKMLESIYERLTDEDKKLFVQLSMQNKNHEEIMQALSQQKADLEAIKRKQNWAVDFGSDVAANLFTDSLIWIGSKLFKKL